MTFWIFKVQVAKTPLVSSSTASRRLLTVVGAWRSSTSCIHIFLISQRGCHLWLRGTFHVRSYFPVYSLENVDQTAVFLHYCLCAIEKTKCFRYILKCCLVIEGKDLRTIAFGFLPHTKQVNSHRKIRFCLHINISRKQGCELWVFYQTQGIKTIVGE
jgi:hypothetical protein